MGLFNFFSKKRKVNEEILANSNSFHPGIVHCTIMPVEIENLQKAKDYYVAIDFETTGLSPYSNRIIEIGAVKFENGNIVDKFQTLVNPKTSIPAEASKVNHITNEMVKNAPLECDAIRALVNFLGDPIDGNTVFCAHNASFDSSFLAEALRRNEIDAELFFFDTVALSRRGIKNLENYKQETVAEYLDIEIPAAHRAWCDAEVCGRIFAKIISSIEINLKEEQRRTEEEIEASKLTDEQKEWAAFIKKSLMERGLDVEHLSFKRNVSNYLECRYYWPFLKLKFGKRKKYVLAHKGKFRKSDFHVEECCESEGGDENLRVVFETPFELDHFMDYIAKEYTKCSKEVNYEIAKGRLTKRDIAKLSECFTYIQTEEIEELLNSAKERITAKKNEEIAIEAAMQKKKEEKEARRLEKERKDAEPKKSQKRPVLRLDDEGNILEEYESLSQASTMMKVDNSCIRDAANGKQKHAAGFCWKYKDTL